MSEQGLPEILLPGVGDYVANQQSQAAVQQTTEAQDRVASWDSGLADLGVGTDPDFVTTVEHFEGMTHQAMYQAVHGEGGMDAAGLRTMQQVWRENYSDLLNLTMFNRLGLNRIFSDGLWTGAASDVAQVASERYAMAANQIGQVFASVADRLDALAWSAEAVRAAVQPPPGTAVLYADPDDPSQSVLPGLVNPEFSDQDRAARELARQEAVRALNNIYKPTYPPAGSGVPTYVSVPQIAGDVPGAPGGNSPGTPGFPVTTATTPPGAPTAGAPAEATPPGGDTPAGLDPSQLGALEGLLPETGSLPDDPAATTTAGLTPSTTTMPGSPALGTPAPTVENPDQPGRTVNGPGGPGAPSTSTTQPGAIATGARGASPAGRNPMTPMAPGAAANRRQEDDDEHTAPDYLRRVYDEWTEGLAHPAGVIGADPAFERDASDGRPSRPSSYVDGGFDIFADDFTRPTVVPESTRPVGMSVTSAQTGSAAPVTWPNSNVPSVHSAETSAVAPQPAPLAPAPGRVPSRSVAARTEHPAPQAHPARTETTEQAEDNSSTLDSAAADTASPVEPEIFTVTGRGPMMDLDTPGGDSPK
ncbi:hypothetical protein ABZV91_30290 [Nocardia sp. NPDC004568]|uniref:hypothetical protein n=1 Tax=Nocardia sp. NPDC004568 TaxID=3154551 RepID=UPI0033A53FFC